LRKLLTRKIEATPLHDQQRGYRCRGALLVVRRVVKLLQALLVVATVAETPRRAMRSGGARSRVAI
jgi:hypothetical protein